MNEAQEFELRQRLQDDQILYAERCLKIRPKAGGLIPLRYSRTQRIIHDRIEQQLRETGKVRVLILKARQVQASTYTESRFYHKVTHRFGVKAFILTHHSDATENIFTMTERFHENCPAPFRPRTGASNARELAFEQLDSVFEVGTARTEGIGRSDTIQYLHGSEVAFWDNAEKHVDGLLQAVPNAPGTEVILESTANGPAGVFFNMCMAAINGESDYRLIFIAWFDHDEYRERPPADWKKPPAFRDYQQLHDLKDDQIYWAWLKNRDITTPVGGSPDEFDPKFRQEYPATPHEAFQTTSEQVLIKPEHVERARKQVIEPWIGSPLIVGVDVARGGKDRTRIVDRQGRRVGRYVNETMNTDDLMKIVGRIGRLRRELNPAPDLIVIDVTGIGAGVYDRCMELGWHECVPCNYGAGADDSHRYANKRAEIWCRFRDMIQDEQGMDLPDLDYVTTNVASATYSFTSDSRYLLEDKKAMKKRLGFSPDFGDAVAQTFAEFVGPRDEEEGTGNADVADTYDEVEI